MDTSYTALVPRLTHLSMGVLASVLVGHPSVIAKLSSPRARAVAAAAASLLFLTLFGNRFGPYPDPTHPLADPATLLVGAVGVTGLLQPASLAFLIALAVVAPSESRISRVLSARAWGVVSDVSYDVYLLHPMVVLGVWTVFPPSTWFHVTQPKPWAFLGVSTVVLGASTLAAHAHSAVWTRVRPCVRMAGRPNGKMSVGR
jgi:peptidoglycan/LPS O-acetylase OafA/YrhL